MHDDVVRRQLSRRTLWSVPCFLCFIAGITVRNAVADPVSHDERVDGDLPLEGAPILKFENGENSITGTFGHLPSDFDAFAFTIPRGSRLIAGQVSHTDVLGDIKNGDWVLRMGSRWLNGTSIASMVAESPGVAILSAVPLEANVYSISLRGFLSVDEPTLARYEFEFFVVPEPGSAVLLIILGIAASATGRHAIR